MLIPCLSSMTFWDILTYSRNFQAPVTLLNNLHVTASTGACQHCTSSTSNSVFQSGRDAGPGQPRPFFQFVLFCFWALPSDGTYLLNSKMPWESLFCCFWLTDHGLYLDGQIILISKLRVPLDISSPAVSQTAFYKFPNMDRLRNT